jgi:filamentous hemagglutinin
MAIRWVSPIRPGCAVAPTAPALCALTTSDLQRLAVNSKADFYYDVRSGNINVIQEVDGRLLRITTPSDVNKIISVGPIRANQVQNLIKRGAYVPIGGGG